VKRPDPPLVALAAVAVVGFAARAWGAFDDGIYWPDEIYQSFEMAHRLVFGNGLIPWEFVQGARNWSMPAVVALLLGTCKGLGLTTPFVYLRVVKVAFAVLGVVTGLGVYRLARSFSATPWAAFAGSALWLLAGPAIYFGPRAMAENACAAPLVWGTALLFEASPSRKQTLWGASLLGLAVLFRLQVVAAVLAIVIALAVKRQWKVLWPALGMLAAWAIFYGGLDAATWHNAPNVQAGGWFHSVVVYLRFNVLEGRGAHWGTSDWTYFFHYLWTSMPTITAILGLGVIVSLGRKQWVLPTVIALFVALHLPIGHKELRFMLPALPIACACAAIAFSFEVRAVQLRALSVALVAATISFVHVPSLTMGELGAYLERPQSSAWDDFGHINRLLLAASRQPDLCGLRMDAADMAWTGGSTYLHTNAKLYRPYVPPQTGFFNYVIAAKGIAGLEVIAEDHGAALYRLPITTCSPDPSFTWQLG
jgi:GPI mannosyltransferase 3